MEHLSIVSDPRVDRTKKHKLIDILIITFCASLSGCEEWVEIEDYGEEKIDWLKQFLELPNGIPSHDTFGRVFSILSPEALQMAFWEWLKDFKEISKREIISIDGKFLRGARREARNERSAIAIVSAFATEAGLFLGQCKSELKKEEGEKRATEELLEHLFLKGTIVTIDANGATPRITKRIREKEGDYLIGLKRNQKVLLKFAEDAFEKTEDLPSYRTESRGHGRYEIREYWQLNVKAHNFGNISKGWYRRKKKWPHLKSFIKVKSERTKGGHTSIEERYYFSSLEGNLEEAARAVRSHWAVESLHWALDVTFREDQSRVRVGHAAQNLALVRRMVLNMLKHQDPKKSIKRKRKKCGWDNRYLVQTLLSL